MQSKSDYNMNKEKQQNTWLNLWLASISFYFIIILFSTA